MKKPLTNSETIQENYCSCGFKTIDVDEFLDHEKAEGKGCGI